MAKTNPTSESVDRSKPINGRRSFIRKTGAALSALVASAAAGFSRPAAGPAAGLKAPVDRLPDADAVRSLHRTYESRLDRHMFEDVVALFAAEAEVVYNGGLFHGKEGIRRLYCSHFASGLTGKRIEPAPGFAPDPAQQPDVVAIADDRKTATGRFPYSIQVGAPMTGDSSLVEMARLQGQGVVQWWEGGIQEASYVREGGAWKIKRLEYRVMSKADYRPGRSNARPITVPQFSEAYPRNPNGPDRIVGTKSKIGKA